MDEAESLVFYDHDTSSKSKSHVPDIDEFAIIKPISRGAFGKVFLGCKKNTPSQLYAIKVLNKSDIMHRNMASQVIRERNALALTKSPFCVQLCYCLQTPTNIFLVMEYLIGGDLKSLLNHYGYFEQTMAVFYITEIALALEYLHGHKIVHRDVKPDNMLLTAKGHVKLTDFGLSRMQTVRDLNVYDLLSATPSMRMNGYQFTRTPGQILSLTSHLSFASDSEASDVLSDSPMQLRTPSCSDSIEAMRNATVASSSHPINWSLLSASPTSPVPENVPRIVTTPEAVKEVVYNPEEGRKPQSDWSFSSIENVSVELDHSLKSSPEFHVPLRRPKKRRHTEENEEAKKKIVKSGMTGIFNQLHVSPEKPLESSELSEPRSSHFDDKENEQRAISFPPIKPTEDLVTPVRMPRPTRRALRQLPKRQSAVSPSYTSDNTILGTPDYLAPELLLRQGHGPAVDWWSLGVCLYEFLLSAPPFNDETTDLIFQNVLQRKIEWPSEEDDCLTAGARAAIEALLTLDPGQRATGATLRTMEIFHEYDWSKILDCEVPFVPQPTDPTDTTYFQARNIVQDLQVSQFQF